MDGQASKMPKKRARVVVVAHSDSGSEYDQDEDAVEVSDIEEDEVDEAGAGPSQPTKICVSLKGAVRCKVCNSTDHQAGFRGATYVDCPNKPCYLCKEKGHTTATCPHRVNPGHGCLPTVGKEKEGVLQVLAKRERDGKLRGVKHTKSKWRVDCAIMRLHHRRCQSLQFHPTKDDIIVSGDKSGELAIWNFKDVNERTVYKHHRANTNTIAFLRGGDGMTCVTSSSDGTAKSIDIEVGEGRVLVDVNPDHNRPWDSNWLTLLGMDVDHSKGVVVVGDSKGVLHFVDPRLCEELYKHKIHKDKVTSCEFNIREPGVLLTSGNDHTAKVFDIRNLSSKEDSYKEVCELPHSRVVNSAHFSPLSGRKILTTCLDNRLRVWDDISRWDGPPDREIIHSHDFNRYLTPFRGVWDPKDLSESKILCGRYISENFDGAALHPVDIFDAADGTHLSEMIDPVMSTISPVNLFHPRMDLIVSGSSRALYVWCPKYNDDEENENPGSKVEQSVAPSEYRFFDAGVDEKKAKKKKAG